MCKLMEGEYMNKCKVIAIANQKGGVGYRDKCESSRTVKITI